MIIELIINIIFIIISLYLLAKLTLFLISSPTNEDIKKEMKRLKPLIKKGNKVAKRRYEALQEELDKREVYK